MPCEVLVIFDLTNICLAVLNYFYTVYQHTMIVLFSVSWLYGLILLQKQSVIW